MKNTLFEQEMKRPAFRKQFSIEKVAFDLELQFLKALEGSGLTYEQFAKKAGISKGNVSRDLRTRGLGRASMERVRKMADALDLDFIPILLPKKGKPRNVAISQLLKKVS